MSAAPRVLLSGVVLGQPMGGVRRHAAELLPRAGRLLAARGGGLAVLEGRPPLPFALPAEVERLPTSVPWRPPLVRATLEGRWVRRALDEARVAGRPFELLHTAHLPVPRQLPLPYVLLQHDLRALALQHSPMSKRLFGKKVVGEAVRKAALVLTVSESVRAELLERFGLAPERVAVVPNAADHLTPLPRAAGEGAPLLHVGHLEPRKNLALVLRALALDPGLPDLELAGAPKAGEDERLRALARELGVAERVRFLGPFEDTELAGLYARAACVVLPSRLEGFGIPALEAQRAGAPLAVADTPALREVAGADTPAFQPDDAQGCARAIRAALARGAAELQRARAAAGRFSWDASAEALVAAWRRAAALHSGSS